MEGLPAEWRVEVGFPGVLSSLWVSPGSSDLPRMRCTPASIQPVLGWVNEELEGGATFFPRTLQSSWGKDELWRGERSGGEEEGGERQPGDLRAAKPVLCPGGTLEPHYWCPSPSSWSDFQGFMGFGSSSS